MRGFQAFGTIAFAMLGAIVACGDDSTDPVDVATVELSATVDTIRGGATVQLTATAKDADGNVLNGRNESWDSDDDGIATVNNSGLVSGLGNGTATISVTVGGVDATAGITVVVGITGTWSGTVTTNNCPITQSVTVAPNGAITGAGTLGLPCNEGPYTVTGTMDAGAVVDSVHMDWAGFFALDFDGGYDGATVLDGFVLGGGCSGVTCAFTFTRSSIIPAAPPAPPATTKGSLRPGQGPLGANR